MKYNENEIENIYQENLSLARKLLATLPIAEGREPYFSGLHGWAYEQTIRYCLCEELKNLGIQVQVEEQKKLEGRARIDLLIGKAAIEIKAQGIRRGQEKTYASYRPKVEQNGWGYFYVTHKESYAPYRVAMRSVFGENRSFFLDTFGDWERFVNTMVEHLAET